MADVPMVEILNPGPNPLVHAASGWEQVGDVLRRNYHNPDIEAARVILSAAAAHSLKSCVPVWVLAIAPPGSMKTDLLEGLRGLPGVHFVDEITPRTFLSGKVDDHSTPNRQRRVKPASLLFRIGSDGILVAADFSTYTADPKTLKIILAQLRRIYDGNYCREFGTDENLDERDWHGRLTVFAGAVPDIDRHYALFQRLGERFTRLRWPRPEGVGAALKAMRHTNRLVVELREAVHGLLLTILKPEVEIVPPIVLPEMELRIANLSELIALSRSHVERDRYSREIVEAPTTEGNTRLPQQLCQLARGSALLDGRADITEDDFELITRAALDSLPPARRIVLVTLIRWKNPYTLGLPSSTVHRASEDLQAAGVVEGVGVDGKQARLSEHALDLLRQAALGDTLLSRNYGNVEAADGSLSRKVGMVE